MSKPLRYTVHNRYQDVPASYHTSLGPKNAYDWAVQNARAWAGEVICEYSDGVVELVWPPEKIVSKTQQKLV